MKRITPFSNGSEFMDWNYYNCQSCDRYEMESTDKNKAGCPMAFDIDLASANDGTIPWTSAFAIGYDFKTKSMPGRCARGYFGPAKMDFSNMNQLKLF